MKISLDGLDYELMPGSQVSRIPVAEWPANMRLDGQQQRKDRSDMSSWAIDQWYNGLGLQHYNVNLTSRVAGLWDVENCDTRWDSFVCLSPKWQDITVTPSVNIDFPTAIAREVYCFQKGVATYLSVAFKYTAPDTMGSYQRLTSSPSYGFLAGLKVVEGRIIAASAFKGKYIISVGSLGSEAKKGGAIHSGVATAVDVQIADIGGTIHTLALVPGNNEAYLYVNSRKFGWPSGTAANVATMSHFVGSYTAPLVGDGTSVYAMIPNSIWDFDMNPSMVVNNAADEEPNPYQSMFRGNLYFKNNYSLIKYGTTLESKGYNQKDGLPINLFGKISCMQETFKWLYAAVKGASYSHILTMDKDNIWQYYARIPSMGRWVKKMLISDQPDDIQRLFCLLDDGTIGFYYNPTIDPRLAGTYPFVGTGHFTMPIFDGGMIEEPGAFYDMSVAGDAISDENIITCNYGLNGEDPTATLGVVATINSSLLYGSPYGVEGYRIQPKFTLQGANSGTSPFFNSAILHYLKIPDEREQFSFGIDLAETARQQTRPAETVIEELNAARRKKILIPFQYGKVATRAVKVTDMPAADDVEFDKIYSGERKGNIEVTVAELR